MSTNNLSTSKVPTVIVDDLNIKYRVILGANTGSAAGALRSLVSGKAPSQVVKSVHAVKGVSLTAYEGDTIGLVGRNGSGKSSLLKAVAGLLQPSSGDVYTASQATLLGVSGALNKAISGNRNITLGGLAMGMSREEVEAIRQQVIDFADIEEFIDMPMGTYSSGMQARLRFSIAAARQHEILLVDETLSTGDTEFRARSQAKIRELSGAAGTVFVVAHGHAMIREVCNRSIWMDKGVIKMDGETNAVLDAYEADVAEKKAAKEATDKDK
jgi:teichoic acid transport system ATP-binding protein